MSICLILEVIHLDNLVWKYQLASPINLPARFIK